MIYFDNAATTIQKPACVIEAVTHAMTSMGNTGRGANDASLGAARVIYSARTKIAGLFQCDRPDHVIFTANSTEALNIAIHGLIHPGDHVITTVMEHNSVLRPLYQLSHSGIELSIVDVDHCGYPDYTALESSIRNNTKAVICTMASNLTGNMPDFDILREICTEHNLLLIADASQTAGCQSVSMESIDVLCFTGHKGLLGPQGTGGMCIRPGVEIEPLISGGTGVQTHLKQQPRQYPTRLEAGTLNGHGIAGLSAAIDYISKIGTETIHKHNSRLAQIFYENILNISGIRFYGDYLAKDRAAIVTLNIRDIPSSDIADILQNDYDIATRAGAHCAPLMHEALGTKSQGAVRFSFGYFNSEDEVLFAANALKEIAGREI